MIDLQPLSVGPIVGHADFDNIRLWGRARYELTGNGTPRRCFGVARIRRKESRGYEPPRYFKMNPNFDMTGIAVFSKLKPNTEYVFQMGWFFSDKDFNELFSTAEIDWHRADKGEFRSACKDSTAPCEFVFGSCRYLLRLLGGNWFDDRGDKTFRTILKQIKAGRETSKLLMVGDQIYADDLKFLSPDNQVDEYLKRYREAFSQRYIRQLMSSVPTYMTLDDHEIEDNWPDRATNRDQLVKYPAAAHAFQTYQVSHSPLFRLNSHNRLEGTPQAYYYQFRDGCCEFFVTDTRTEREPGEDLNSGDIISEQQMQALLAWLGNGFKGVKFVVSSVPFFPDSKKPSKDKWSGFRRQRDRIISCIRRHRLNRVVFLSGDVHCSMAAELDISGEGEKSLKIYSVISSAFYWPYPHAKARAFQLTGHVPSAENDNAYALGTVSEVFSGDNFTRVRASINELAVQVYERKGELVQEVSYQF